MKCYKEYHKQIIGTSDMSSLIFVGPCDGPQAKVIGFDGDGTYSAYIVDDEAVIGDHYELTAEFRSWLKIYDDEQKTREFHANSIQVYRAGGYGTIIRLSKNIK